MSSFKHSKWDFRCHFPSPIQTPSPFVYPVLAHVCFEQNCEAQCTSRRTIATSALNKITPAVPVWLMGRVREQRRRDKPLAAACSISHTLGSIHGRGASWGAEPNHQTHERCRKQESGAASTAHAHDCV